MATRLVSKSSFSSFASITIPKPILRTKGRALRTQLCVFALQVIFTIASLFGMWLTFDLKQSETVDYFGFYSSFAEVSKNPEDNGKIFQVSIVPTSVQSCVYASIAFAILGFVSTFLVTYSSKIPENIVQYLLALPILSSAALFFILVAAQAGFESNVNQIITIASMSGSVKGVDYSARGFGYACVILCWILALPLFLLSITVFIGHIRHIWENEWRQSLRASFGAGIPKWLDAQSSPTVASSPALSVVGEDRQTLSKNHPTLMKLDPASM